MVEVGNGVTCDPTSSGSCVTLPLHGMGEVGSEMGKKIVWQAQQKGTGVGSQMTPVPG